MSRARNESMHVIACIPGPQFVLRGSSGVLYDILCTQRHWSCSCPDSRKRQVVCKHRCFLAMLLLTPYQQTKFFTGQRDFGHLDLSWRFKGRNTECSCCLAELGEDVQVCIECQQGYHSSCILRWMRQSTACPMCRRTFSVISKFCRSTSPVDDHTDPGEFSTFEDGVAVEQAGIEQ